MNQTILAVVLAITLGTTLGSPLQACDKLKNVKEGADNYDQYLVLLKDSDNYMDAEYIINLVTQYQTILEQYASNVYEPSAKSQLELSENAAGVLHGTLSQQALILVCLESRVEYILPDYPSSIIDPQGSGMGSGEAEDVYALDCFKLVLSESYHGSNYSVTFKRKSSLNTLYRVITQMELAKLNDSTINFEYYHSIKKGNQLTMAVGMNLKALNMVCKEGKVKQIEHYDATIITKRNAEIVFTQDPIIPSTLNDHCGMPEHVEEFPTFIFVYSKGASLDEIIKSLKEYNENSARIILAVAIEQLHMIIFQMSRAAYLQACRNPEIALVEYAKPITLNSPATTPTPKPSPPNTPLPTEATNVCQHIDSLQDKNNTYTVLLNKPITVEDKRKRCLKVIKKLNYQGTRSGSAFHAVTYPQQSCQINGNDMKLVAKLNFKALKYVCAFKGLQVSVTQ